MVAIDDGVGVRGGEGAAGAAGATLSEARCPICLDPVSGEAFLDQCFHMFCYHCILQWSEMALARPQSTSNRLQCLKCPLCKRLYNSIIHDLSGEKFQRDYILTARGTRHFRLKSHIQREAVYTTNTERTTSKSLSSVPKPNRWLFCWVHRELQALMQEEDVETVTQHVVGVVETFSKRFGVEAGFPPGNREIKSNGLNWHTTVSTAVLPFIFEHSEKFAEELGSFLESGLDIAAYDRRRELGTSTAGNTVLGNNISTGLPTEDVPIKRIDLYDADVDDNGLNATVRSQSIEAQVYSSDESQPGLPLHNLKEDVQGRKHPYREVSNKVSIMPVRPSGSSDEDSYRGRSKQEIHVSYNSKIYSRGVHASSPSRDKSMERRKAKSTFDRSRNKRSRKSRKQVDFSDEDLGENSGKHEREVGKKKKKKKSRHGRRTIPHTDQHRDTGVKNKEIDLEKRHKKPTYESDRKIVNPRSKRRKSSVISYSSISESNNFRSPSDSSTSSDVDSPCSSCSESDVDFDSRKSHKNRVNKVEKGHFRRSNETSGHFQMKRSEQIWPDRGSSGQKDRYIKDHEGLPDFSNRQSLSSERSPTLRHLKAHRSRRAKTEKSNDNKLFGGSVQVLDHTSKEVRVSTNPALAAHQPRDSVIRLSESSKDSDAGMNPIGSFPAPERRVEVNKDLSLEAELRKQALINYRMHLSQKKARTKL